MKERERENSKYKRPLPSQLSQFNKVLLVVLVIYCSLKLSFCYQIYIYRFNLFILPFILCNSTFFNFGIMVKRKQNISQSNSPISASSHAGWFLSLPAILISMCKACIQKSLFNFTLKNNFIYVRKNCNLVFCYRVIFLYFNGFLCNFLNYMMFKNYFASS